MGNKVRLLTLDDLYSYYVSKNENITFSAVNDNERIVVQVPGNILFASKDNKDTEGLMPVHLQSCHTLTNLNQSHIDEEVMKSALSSFSNRPILGFLHKVNDQWEFYGHNMHQDEDGNIEYDEVPVGIVPESCNAQLVYDEDKKKTYVEIDGYIFEEYSHAAEVLQREEECSVSVELSIRELSYNAKEKYLDIKDFFFSGVTILGKTDNGDEVKPGMAGANIKIADFSKENNSNLIDINEKLDSFFERISNLLNNINEETQNNSTKGGNNQMSKFEELLEKYNKTVEDINFEYEGLTDEELEAAFAEAFEEDSVSEGDAEEVDNEEIDDNEETIESEENDNDIEETDGLEDSEEENNDDNKFTKTFSISHEDIKSALYTLLMPYEEADGDWYYISAVYDDNFAYEGWCTGSIYGQKYIKDGDNVSFDGERYALHRELLTDSEYAQLNEMRSNYSSIVEKLAKYEAEPDKEKILKSESYSKIVDTEEFKELKNNHFDLSVDEVSAKADEILLAYAKNGKIEFSVNENNKGTNRVSLPTQPEERGRYGGLFRKKK